MPVLPAAPARLSMIIGWPSDMCREVARMRAMMSVGPPGAKGTIRVIGRSGHAAWAGVAELPATSAVKAVENERVTVRQGAGLLRVARRRPVCRTRSKSVRPARKSLVRDPRRGSHGRQYEAILC